MASAGKTGGNKKRSSPSAVAYYKRYKTQGLWRKNKIARLEKHIKRQPTDVKAIAALKAFIRSGLNSRPGKIIG